MTQIFFLLILFQIKHFLCDFPLQGKYMLGKFKLGKDWILPLMSHAGVHFLGTLSIISIFNIFHHVPKSLYFLALMDFCIHFVVDRIKASPNLLGRWKPDSRYFWWALGADQFMHHMTHYLIIFMLLRG